MKNIFNKFVFFIALSFVFISCGNLTTSENDDSIPQGKGKITISTDLQNGRSVLPTAITQYTEGLKWELFGVKAEESKQIGYWEDDTDKTAYQKMVADTSLLVDTGTWDFTLTASLTASQNNATEELNVLQAQCNSVQIDAGNNALNFVMQEATEKAASGSIEFTLNFPKDVVDNVVATLYKYDNNNTVLDTNRQLTIDKSSNNNFDSVKYSYSDATGTTSSTLSAGYYILKIELQQDTSVQATATDYQPINTYSCLIRVAPGLLSTGKYTLTDLAQLYTISYLDVITNDDGTTSTENATFDSTETITVTYNEYTSFELPTPIKDGYKFLGWYTDETFGTPVTLTGDGQYFINSDTSLYAKWEEIPLGSEENPFTNWDDLSSYLSESSSDASTIYVKGGLTVANEVYVHRPVTIIPIGNVTMTTSEKSIFYPQCNFTLKGDSDNSFTLTDNGSTYPELISFDKSDINVNLQYCTFSNGSIYLNVNSSLQMQNCTLKNYSGSYGTLWLKSSSSVTIEDCIFENNTAYDIYIENSPSLTLDGTVTIPKIYFDNSLADNDLNITVGDNLATNDSTTISINVYSLTNSDYDTTLFSSNIVPIDIFELANSGYELNENGTITATSIVTNAYYVSATGSDDNDGLSYDKPFKTLNKAITSANDATLKNVYVIGTLNAASENFSNITDNSASNSVFYLSSRFGTSDSPITICGYPNSNATLSAADTNEDDSSPARVFTSYDSSYITLQDLTITGGGTTGSGGAIYYYGGKLTLKNCIIKDNASSTCNDSGIYYDGIYMFGSSSLEMSNTKCYDSIYLYSSTATIGEGCEIGYNDSSVTLPIMQINNSTVTISDSVGFSNSIYSDSNNPICVGSTLTYHTSEDGNQITIMLSDYDTTNQIISVSEELTLATEVKKFTLFDANYIINDEGFVKSSGGGIAYNVGEAYYDDSNNLLGYIFDVGDGYIKIAYTKILPDDDNSSGFLWSVNEVPETLIGINDGDVLLNTIKDIDEDLSDYPVFSQIPDGWYLPTKDEFQLMYDSIDGDVYGGWDNGFFWTSTLIDSTNCYYFGDYEPYFIEGEITSEYNYLIPVKKISIQ